MLDTLDEALDFAIREEEQAAAFYRALAQRMPRPNMRKVFEDFAREEDAHRAKLVAVKQGARLPAPDGPPLDLKIVDYLAQVSPFAPELDYQQALVVAMHKEKAAYVLYTSLAEKAADPVLRDLFLGMAQEEARHKLRFEIEYDEGVLIWN